GEAPKAPRAPQQSRSFPRTGSRWVMVHPHGLPLGSPVIYRARASRGGPECCRSPRSSCATASLGRPGLIAHCPLVSPLAGLLPTNEQRKEEISCYASAVTPIANDASLTTTATDSTDNSSTSLAPAGQPEGASGADNARSVGVRL